MTRFRRPASQILYGLAALFLIAAASFVFISPAGATAGGTGWGPGGSTGPTGSAVTVRWDNTAPGQPSYDQVPRTSSQILPYTGGATYDQDSPVSEAAKQAFGNLSLTVDQTESLGHQAVSLSYTGVANPGGDSASLDVFQCWGGGSAADGVTAGEPDPTHCEAGAEGRFIASQDSGLIAKGNLPSPLSVAVSGYANPDGTSAHLWAQVEFDGGGAAVLSPGAGTVRFATTNGRELGQPVPIRNGIAVADVSGLTKGVETGITATFVPAKGQNYTAAVPSQPLTLPDDFAQGLGTNLGALEGNNANNSGLYSGSLVKVAAPAGTFKPGRKIRVGLNFSNGTTFHSEFGVPVQVPNPPGRSVDQLGDVTAASDGSATMAFRVPSLASLPPNPKGGAYGYVLLFTDLDHPKVQTIDIAGIQPFAAPVPNGTTTANRAPANQTSFVPFTDIEGNPQANGLSDFTVSTTNEFAHWFAPASASATATREFTVTTTLQDPNLGCGIEAGTPSTSTCWLVIVPEENYPLNSDSPLTPSIWAQRLQVRLGFAPLNSSCSPTLPSVNGIGSELLANAMNSWVPAICAADKVVISYSAQRDSVARQQYEAGSTKLIFTTEPVGDRGGGGASTLYAPAGLAGVTIGLSLPTSDGQLTKVRLNARLVAKLLTQSYQAGIDPGTTSGDPIQDPVPCRAIGSCGIDGFVPWANTAEFQDLFADPEFQALNPGFSYTPPTEVQDPNSGFDNLGSLVVSSTASDPIAVLWRWILSDPQAKAFLDGCPDAASKLDGRPTVVNPYFATDSYAQCRPQAAALSATAKREIAETTARFKKYARAAAPDLAKVTPVVQPFNYTYKFTPARYSASNPQFPLPAWYVFPPNGIGGNFVSESASGDLHAEEVTLANVETDIAAGAPPWSVSWCATCVNGDGGTGVWNKESASFFSPVAGITDTPASAQFQTVTAQLCDDKGHCVGADSDSVLKAAARFRKTKAPGVLTPSMTPAEAGGAYPLTVPVYAAVNVTGLSATEATAYADLLRYLSTTGNQPGLTPGTLPSGYAPLPSKMLAQDAAAVKELDKLAKAAGSSPSPAPSSSSAPSPSPSGTVTTPATSSSQSPAPSSSSSALSPSASPSVISVPYRSMTAATSVWLSQYGVFGTLGAAIVCAGLAPFIGRSRRPRKGGSR
jgi:hypothetical protein